MERIKYTTNKETVGYNVLALFLIIFTILILGQIDNMDNEKIVKISDNWKITHNNDGERKCKIKEYKLDKIKKGDTFILKHKIDKKEIKNNDIRQVGIMIEENFIEVKAWIDDKLIYSDIDKRKHVISIDDMYLDKEIKIEYKVTCDSAFSVFNDINYIDEYSYATNTLGSGYSELILCGFMMLLGVCAIILTITKTDIISYRIFLTGSFMICLGGWLLSNNTSYNIFSEERVLRNILKYFMLYFGVPLFGIMLSTFIHDKLKKNILYIVIVITTVVVIISTVIVCLDDSKAFDCLTLIEILGIIIIILGIGTIILERNMQSKTEKQILTAYLILGISMGHESGSSIVSRSLGRIYSASTIMKIGMILFLVVTIDAYVKSAVEILDNYVEKAELSSMAYQDVLTGLSNRSMVMDEINKIKTDNIKEYSIINFDLNDLKKINDVKGHKIGDAYLCIFSDIVKRYLLEYFDVIGRIGGDEFVAISKRYIKIEKLESIIKKITKNVAIQCKKKYNIDASFAYGYAMSKTKDKLDFDDAYRKADKMMYECKRKMKECSKMNVD